MAAGAMAPCYSLLTGRHEPAKPAIALAPAANRPFSPFAKRRLGSPALAPLAGQGSESGLI